MTHWVRGLMHPYVCGRCACVEGVHTWWSVCVQGTLHTCTHVGGGTRVGRVCVGGGCTGVRTDTPSKWAHPARAHTLHAECASEWCGILVWRVCPCCGVYSHRECCTCGVRGSPHTQSSCRMLCSGLVVGCCALEGVPAWRACPQHAPMLCTSPKKKGVGVVRGSKTPENHPPRGETYVHRGKTVDLETTDSILAFS